MNFAQIVKYIQAPIPQEKSFESQAWLDCNDALGFLINSSVEQVPIYISARHFFVYAILVPKTKLRGKYVNNILGWNTSISSGWGYSYSIHDFERSIVSPLDHTNSAILDGGEALVFLRSIHNNGETYLELNQRLTHILDIHKIETRQAYCRSERGTGNLINIVSFTPENEDNMVCTIDRKALEFYMFLTDTILVQLFDVTRWHSGSFSGWQEGSIESMYEDKENHLFARRVQTKAEDGSKNAGYIRGFHLVRPKLSEKQFFAELRGTREKKKYVSVIAIDFKHGKIAKCSCDPKKLGNYFVQSDLPYGTSPAFFKPEVLLRYKQDTDKYELSSGSISCRGGWWLRYHTNDAGQIQLYLKDISSLPYSEQLYWQSFNEEPKAGVSDMVIRRDFFGEWTSSPDPLEELKQIARHFPLTNYRGEDLAIFKIPTEKQLARLTYVFTDSAKEWEDQILELAKVLVDGLQKAGLRKIAKELGCDNSQLGSRMLLKICLETKGLDAEVIKVINDPLYRLYELRSSIAAHAGKSAPNEDLKQHHRKLLQECKQAMETLSELIRDNFLDIL